jgi:hypothetical protein
MDIVFGEISGLAACKSSIETPKFKAMLLIVSPEWTVYVKGVGLGRGVSATTRLSGVRDGARVEVEKGIRVEGIAVESAAGEIHEMIKKRTEGKRTRIVERCRLNMRRL